MPDIMQEFVAGVPPLLICLLRWVSRLVPVYIDVVEAAKAEEAEEAIVQGERGDQGGQAYT